MRVAALIFIAAASLFVTLVIWSSAITTVSAQQQTLPTSFTCTSSTPTLMVSKNTESKSSFPEGININVENGCQSVTVSDLSLSNLNFGLMNEKRDALLSFNPRITLNIRDCSLFLPSSSNKRSDISFSSTNNASFSSSFWRNKIGNIEINRVSSTWNLPQTFAASSISFIEFPFFLSSSATAAEFSVQSLTIINSTLAVTSSSTTATARADDISLVSTRVLSSSSISSSSSSATLSITDSFSVSRSDLTVSDTVAEKSSSVAFLLLRNFSKLDASLASSFSMSDESSISCFTRRTKSAQFIRVEKQASIVKMTRDTPSSSSAAATFSDLTIAMRSPSSSPKAQLPPPSPFTSIFTFEGQAPATGNFIISDITISMPPPSALALQDSVDSYKFYVFGGLNRQNSFPSTAKTSWTFERITVTITGLGKTEQVRTYYSEDDNFIRVFGFAAQSSSSLLNTGFNSTFSFVNFSWSCDPVQRNARQQLATSTSSSSSSANKIIDGCYFPPPPPPTSSFASDLKEGAAALFSTAIVSAASMSAVAFSASRSQEVGEFVGLAATGKCIAANATEVPIFSDSPLGLELPQEYCGYYGGTIAGNFALFFAASFVSLFFGLFGACVKQKGWGVYHVMDYGFFGVIISCGIGLLLTPTIQHATLCAVRPGSHIGARVVAGLIAAVLFFLVPFWSYWVLIHDRIYKKGTLIDNRLKNTPGICSKTLGAAWRYIVGVREWKFVGRGGYLSNILSPKYDEYKKKKAMMNKNKKKENVTIVRGNFDGDEIDDTGLLQVGGMNDGHFTRNSLGFTQKVDETATAGDFEEVKMEHKFHFFGPLFEDYDERFPSFFFVEVLVNALLGAPSLIAEAFKNDDDPRRSCYAFGLPIVIVLLIYFIILSFYRPLQCRLMLLANFAVSGLQLLISGLAIYTVTLGPDSAPSFGSHIDTSLLIAQAVLSFVGILLALRAIWRGGLTKLKNCICPQKEEEDAVETVMRQESEFFRDETMLNEMAAIANITHDSFAQDMTRKMKEDEEKEKNNNKAENDDDEKATKGNVTSDDAEQQEEELEIDLNVDDDVDDDIPPPPNSNVAVSSAEEDIL